MLPCLIRFPPHINLRRNQALLYAAPPLIYMYRTHIPIAAYAYCLALNLRRVLDTRKGGTGGIYTAGYIVRAANIMFDIEEGEMVDA